MSGPFARSQSHVAFVDLQAEAGEALAKKSAGTGGTALFFRCDVTDVGRSGQRSSRGHAKLGPIGFSSTTQPTTNGTGSSEVSPEYWDRTQNVNLRHHFFAAQAVHPQMRQLGFGSIINLSSIAWRAGAGKCPPIRPPRRASSGSHGALARAFGDDNIRVNAIEPGAVMTDRQTRLWYKTPESVEAIVQRQLIKSTLIGEDVARMALFLGADDSRMITKQSIAVDAGLR